MPDVKEILELMDRPSKADTELVRKAFAFSEKAHEGHTRYSGEPYFTHSFATAKGLAELGMDAATVAAGLLHDSLEDVGVAEETLEKEFGPEILFLVQGVTKLGALKYRGVERHAESLRKLFVATSQDIRVLIIKLMDRLHNMRTLAHVPANKQRRIALETLEIYAPIADRLGMGQLRGALADLAFPYVYPKEYEEVKKLLKERSREDLKHLDKIRKTLVAELGKAGIRNFRTDLRLKHLYSLFRKLERKNWDIEKIHDISALRVILPSVADCYRVLGVVHSLWRPLPGKIKDYIAFPKPNGYQSLHTTVFAGDGHIVEIQIRTETMHREAEYGIASHFAYKEGVERRRTVMPNLQWIAALIPPAARFIARAGATGENRYSPKEIPAWVKQLAEAQRDVPQSTEFLERLKSDFFSTRVFVFTPKGDVVDLPAGSSPIDFAYAIHSDVGDHAAGAKVNGKLVSLDTTLYNGDIVEIVTKESARPSPKWVEFTKTTLAKRHIRSALAEAERSRRS